jgi:hypothetical protein
MVYTMQRLTLYVLIALAIASGVEGSDYTNTSSVEVAVKLAKAYSIICLFLFNIPDVRYLPPHCQCNPMGWTVVPKANDRRCGMFLRRPH